MQAASYRAEVVLVELKLGGAASEANDDFCINSQDFCAPHQWGAKVMQIYTTMSTRLKNQEQRKECQ